MMRRLAGLILLLTLLSLPALAAIKFPVLTGRVVDDAHVLRGDTVQQLTATLQAHEQQTGEQIVVVTLHDLQGQQIEDYGYQLGRAWGIGQKGKDNGALLIVAPKEHKVRIEVGYGLEGKLTDAASAQIIQTVMVPAFRRGDYDAGVVGGTNAVLSTLDGDNVENQTQPISPVAHTSGQNLFSVILTGLILFFFITRFFGSGSAAAPFFLGTTLGRASGGFGSGGGFGGFSGGGGSFGGGGASGSW